MKTLLASAALLLTFGIGGTALAQPGGHHAYDNDGYGYGDYEQDYAGDYNSWGDGDATVYDVPDFDRKVRRGFTFRRIKRMMRRRMRARIDRKTQRIRARFGPGRHARRMIRRMERRERNRFHRRLAFVRTRFDQLRRASAYVEPAPTYTYTTPTYQQPTYQQPTYQEYQHPTYPDRPRNRDRRDRRDRRY